MVEPVETTGSQAWSWDPSLYAGAAGHYVRGRVAYPSALATTVAAGLGLDGTQRLLDVGCGPGSLTALLAPYVGSVTGLDPDPGMLAEARRRLPTATFVEARAETLPAGLGPFEVVTLAQSFHWMDRELVPRLLRRVLTPGGAVVHVSARTHQGEGDVPWGDVEALIERYLGPQRRAGQGTLTGPPASEAETSAYETRCFADAGYAGPDRLLVPGWTTRRTADQVVDGVLSLSYAAPHLFGDRLAAFERDLRDLLAAARPEGVFTERMREIRLDVWRAPDEV